MKFLVTGANGFVGCNLLEVMKKNNAQVIAVVHSENSSISEIKRYDNVRIVYCAMEEISDLPHRVSDRDIDCCIHLAWAGATGANRGDYSLQMKNIECALELCNALAEMKVRRFVGAGTLVERDVNHYIPRDGATPDSVALYGVAKLCAEYMTKTVCTNLNIEHIWCTLSNIYGVGDCTNNFVIFATKLMLNGEHAAFTSGEQMRDFVYVKDAAKGIFLAATLGRKNYNYYVGSGHPRKLKDYIVDIRDCVNPDIELFLGEIPFNGVCLPDKEFDCTKLVEDTGYVAEISFKEGIEMLINWIRGEK